ncbi:MAG TPA: GNAT family N-acetyltransferase [Pyrinomonadaceae bacterium]|jgi:ribosomal protein S18 acetylase RimI-like enzyme
MSVEPLAVSVRPVEPGDEPFLFEVYSSTRADEMAAWGWNAAQQEAFLRMQFKGQQGFYRMQYPEAEHQIILLGDRPVGRMIVIGAEDEIRLADIVVLPEFRNRGIGASLIRDLCAEAERQNVPVRLRVLKSNRDAARLYERMGFAMDGESDTHFDMAWHSGAR